MREVYNKVLDDAFWEKWESNTYKKEFGSFISLTKLSEEERGLGWSRRG